MATGSREQILSSAAALAVIRGGAAGAQGDLQRTTRQRLGSWWAADPNPCGWEGIFCSFPDLRIQSIGIIAGVLAVWLPRFPNPHKFAIHAARRRHLPQHRQAHQAAETPSPLRTLASPRPSFNLVPNSVAGVPPPHRQATPQECSHRTARVCYVCR